MMYVKLTHAVREESVSRVPLERRRRHETFLLVKLLHSINNEHKDFFKTALRLNMRRLKAKLTLTENFKTSRLLQLDRHYHNQPCLVLCFPVLSFSLKATSFLEIIDVQDYQSNASCCHFVFV